MVVMSIISLLSSVVLGAVNSARTKANTSQISSAAEEYRKAFSFGYDKYGGYPSGMSAFPTSYCLGYSTSCNSGGDPVVNGIVSESLSALPSSDLFKFFIYSTPMSGPSYIYSRCTSTNGSSNNKNACNTASISWYSPANSCAPGTGGYLNGTTPSTYWCTLVLD